MKNMWIDGARSIHRPSPAVSSGVRSSPTVRSTLEEATRTRSPTVVPRVTFSTRTRRACSFTATSWPSRADPRHESGNDQADGIPADRDFPGRGVVAAVHRVATLPSARLGLAGGLESARPVVRGEWHLHGDPRVLVERSAAREV